MPVVHLTDPHDPRVAPYRSVRDPAALRASGLFVAEGRTVVRRLLTGSRFTAHSVLLTQVARQALDKALVQTNVPVYETTVEILAGIVGYDLHQGCIALGVRAAGIADATIESLPAGRQLIAVVEQVRDPDNLGSIFRNAHAFGACAGPLSPGCCDPLYRKTIRTSMAAALHVPFGVLAQWPDALADLRRAGFQLIALTPDERAIDISLLQTGDDWLGRVAVMIGCEGEGLSEAAMQAADARVRIPMAHCVDSLNLATAAGIALYHFSHDVSRPDLSQDL